MAERGSQPARNADAWLPSRPTLASLRSHAEDCRGCDLWREATQTVFSEGRAGARMMLVGEQPGDREDREGRPFVGPAGSLLTEALTASGLQVADLYITNAVKHFRFERSGKKRLHRSPTVSQLVACNPWLRAELEVVRPGVVVCLGAVAGRAITGRQVSIARERGRELEVDGVDAPVVITTHPSAVVRLRGRPEFDEALAGLVDDLGVAASLTSDRA